MKIGDFVTIAEGPHAGQCGTIEMIEDDIINIECGKYVFICNKDQINRYDEIPRVWMIYNDRGGLPKRVYKTRESAIEEMDRLAKSNTEVKFLLLESVAEISYNLSHI